MNNGSPHAGTTVNGSTTGAPDFADSNDQNMRRSYIQQWNFNVLRKLPLGMLLDAGCAGTKGTHLIVTVEDHNRPIQIVDPRSPGLAALNARRPNEAYNQAYRRNVRSDKSSGNSIYHALQVKAERRMGRGFTFLSAYTWSKAISGPNYIGGRAGGGNFIGAPRTSTTSRASAASPASASAAGSSPPS